MTLMSQKEEHLQIMELEDASFVEVPNIGIVIVSITKVTLFIRLELCSLTAVLMTCMQKLNMNSATWKAKKIPLRTKCTQKTGRKNWKLNAKNSENLLRKKTRIFRWPPRIPNTSRRYYYRRGSRGGRKFSRK